LWPIFLAARTVHVPLPFFVVLAIGPVLLLAHILPISISGWGVREAAAVALLGMTGVDATSAILVSIMFGVLLVLAALPGALFWLMLRE
jgi:glycosyltransferase 2 family protein